MLIHLVDVDIVAAIRLDRPVVLLAGPGTRHVTVDLMALPVDNAPGFLIAPIAGKATARWRVTPDGGGLIAVVIAEISSLILCGALTSTYLVVHMWCKPGMRALKTGFELQTNWCAILGLIQSTARQYPRLVTDDSSTSTPNGCSGCCLEA
jgi:hypothetical protein